MFRFVKFYYGMSGSFKATTIKSKLKRGVKGQNQAMWSEIKPWKDLEKNLFNNLNGPNNINLAMLHLIRLKDFVQGSHLSQFINLFVERGVSDMMFYWSGLKDCPDNMDIINMAIQKELDICEQNSYYIPDKVLLIQKDIDFITDVILKEPTRAECFPGGLQDYLDAQDRYIEFTKKYNKITEEVVIKDAESYITNDLGLEFKI